MSTLTCGCSGDPGVDELDVVQGLLLAQQVFVTAGVTHLQTREILRRHTGQADQVLTITLLTLLLSPDKSYHSSDSAMSLLSLADLCLW